MKCILSILLLALSPALLAIEITTENATKSELATVELLKALRASHDTNKWEFIDKVHINEKAIPHSHPLLTLHTRHTSKAHKDFLLSTYLHEQIHWHISKNEEKTKSAIEELKTIFKDVPNSFPEGAGNEFSTYLHLLVCFLEMEAISELLSAQRVKAVMSFWQQDHYTWVYRQVEQKNSEIKKVLDNHGLLI
ncbi:hypothetical protein [Thalassotalea ganghwensis]